MYYKHYNTRSLLRRAQYDALAEVEIDGKILDIGGSKKSGYQELIKGNHSFTTAGIDEAYGIDLVFDAQKPWPIEDASYEAVFFINLLEHLYGYQNAVSESYRVLKQGGKVVGVVPFMFNVHGSPNDYFRYTKSALEQIFKDAGYSEVSVEELGTGAFSVIYHCLMSFIRWNWLANLLINFFVSVDKIIFKIKPVNKLSATYMPLGYIFVCRK
jgi:SAM-dependent methyltransferase